MEVLFFEPVYKDYIWGGTRLKDYLKKNVQTPTVAESWEISSNEDGISKIRNPAMRNITLKELFENKDERINIFGTKTENMEKFPLLIKFIDAKNNLSVQVHPNNEYAKKYEKDTGKTEMWYIIDCDPNAQIICGLKENIKQKNVEEIIRNNQIKENLNYVNIQKGDVVYIPAGTIHAILGNTLICEIQQNSNLTYRVYDWDRVGKDGRPRSLHIDKAIDVIDVNAKSVIKHSKDQENMQLIKTQFFNVQKLKIEEKYNDVSSKESFFAINVIEGTGRIETIEHQYEVKKGDTFLIPAKLGNYCIKGNLEILKTSID